MFFFLEIVNLQYLTILIKFDLQDVNFQFQYRSPNCEIKRSHICFLFLSWKQACTVTKGHVCCNFFSSLASATMRAPSTSNTHPLKSNSIKVPIEFLHGDPIFSIVYSIK